MGKSTPWPDTCGRSLPTLLVLARHPVRGQVKTRLARRIGEATACTLYEAFIADIVARTRTLPCATAWAYWPPDAPFAPLVAGARCFPQCGRDLGERMADAVRHCLQTAPAVIAVGADVPHVTESAIGGAARALGAGADVVLGPARDGGFYLIGVRQDPEQLFAGIPWGSGRVFRATMDRARQLGLRIALVEDSYDVDECEDLDTLVAELKAGTISLAHTTSALRRLGLWPPS